VVQATVSNAKKIEPEEEVCMKVPDTSVPKSTSGASLAPIATGTTTTKTRVGQQESKKGLSHTRIQELFSSGRIEKSSKNTLKRPTVSVLYELPFTSNPLQEIQESFGSSKKFALKVTMNGTEVTMSSTRQPCNGVKRCSEAGCEVVISRNRRQCKAHPAAKVMPWCDQACPVSLFTFEAPGDTSNKWIGLFTSTATEAHNHPESPEFKITEKTQQLITTFVMTHPEATAAETVKQLSTSLALTSAAAIDVEAVANLRKRTLSQVLGNHGTAGLEQVNEYLLKKFRKECEDAGEVFEGDILTKLSLNDRQQLTQEENNGTKVGILTFPYLRSITRHQDGLVMWTCAIPLLVGELAKATEWQIDATYSEMTKEGGRSFYLLNINSFSPTALRWLTPVRIRFNAKTELAYIEAFKALRDVLREDCPEFSVSSLECVLFDFEVGMSKAFTRVFGEETEAKIKGCQVHWKRSAKAQRDKVCEGEEEKKLWWLLMEKVLIVRTREDFVGLFDALCGGDLDRIRHLLHDVKKAQSLPRTNWHKSRNWAKFFNSDRVAKMLNQVANQLLPIPGSTSTNAAESLNNQVKDGVSRPPVLATVTAHQLDMRLALEVFTVENGGQWVLRANSPAKRMLARTGRGKDILSFNEDFSSPASAFGSDDEPDETKTPEVQTGERSQIGTSISRTQV